MWLFKPNIDKLKTKRDIEGLIKAFQDKDIDVRKDAAKALGDIGDESAVEPLTESLLKEEPRFELKGDVIEALAKIGDKRAIEFLIKALENDNMRSAATEAFEEIWSKYPEKMEETIPRLMNLLESENRQTKLGIAEVIGIISRKKPEMVEEAVPKVIDLLIEEDERRAYFLGEEERIRVPLEVIGNVGEIRPELVKDAIHALIGFLDMKCAHSFINSEGNVGTKYYSVDCGNVIYALGRIGAVDALEILKRFVNEKESCEVWDLEGDLRKTTIGELAREAVGWINRRVEKHPELLRASKTFWQIRELVDAHKTEKLIDLYCSGVDIISEVIRLFTDGNYFIRRDAAYIFGEIGKRYPEEVKDGISKLANLLVDQEEFVHESAFESLIEIGIKRHDLVVGAIPAMVRYRGFPEIANDLNELVSSDFESAKVVTSNLINLLYDDNDKVREIAAFALGVIGEERPELVKNAIPPLLNLLKEEKNVRFVSFVLGAIGKNRPEWIKNAIPKLVEILKKWKNKEVEIIITSAIGNIGRNNPEMVREAIPELIDGLRGGKKGYDIELRVTAAEALIKIGKLGEESGKIISKIIEYLLSEEDAYAREKGSLFLGALKEYQETKEAIPLLVKLLDDPCWRVRGAAAFALGEIEEIVRDPKSLRTLADGTPLMTRLLDDDKAWVRLSAAYALSEIGGVDALEELKKLENDNERSKIWYLGEEREFEVKTIVNEAVEKIEARIEGREIRPKLNVSLSKTKLKKEVQSVALFVENKGKVSARDIEIVFPDVLRVEGLSKFSLRAGESRKFELEIEPKKVGMISLTSAISFSDFKGNEYGSTEKFELEVEKAAITPERVVVGEKGVIIERTIYDPCKRDFIEIALPRMNEWINRYDQGAYWFAVSIQNNTDRAIEEWDVDLEFSSALKIEEAKIEGIEYEIPNEAHLGLFKISVPKEYGIVIPKGGAQRVYFKLRAEKPKTTYEISGVFKSKITGDVPIRPKEFKYLCDAGMPPEAVKAELKKTLSEKEAARLALSFKSVQELDRMCNQNAETEECQSKLLLLKNYTEGFSENFTMQVDDFSRFMEQEQMGYLDDEYKRKVRMFCTNLVDVWISEFLKGEIAHDK